MAKNNAQTLPKQLQNNFEKVQKIDFFDPQNGQKWPLKSAKMSKILTQNLSFQGHLSTFEAQNTPKSRPFEAENKAQTLPKQVQNNFEKVEKSTFFDPQNGQKWHLKSAEMNKFVTPNLDFWGHLTTFGGLNTPKSRLF